MGISGAHRTRVDLALQPVAKMVFLYLQAIQRVVPRRTRLLVQNRVSADADPVSDRYISCSLFHIEDEHGGRLLVGCLLHYLGDCGRDHDLPTEINMLGYKEVENVSAEPVMGVTGAVPPHRPLPPLRTP
ncbi:MAG: hypothetical protein FJ098_05045 [Deltaproteobacteria bacterium]|nr:hypothetical protein [Deltaproteobacteria bacterium]